VHVSEYTPTKDSTLRLNPQLGSYDRELICALIDEAPYCHVSAQVDDRPYIQATVHWREQDKLYIHGARKNKMIHAIALGAEAALAFTHFDGYVLTRSAFGHAVSYRSVTLFAKGMLVEDPAEKNRLLSVSIEKIRPGRWATLRQPTENELKMTGVLEFPIEEVSAKTLLQGAQLLDALPGGKYESEADARFNPWTGIHPYKLVKGEPLSSAEILRAIREPRG
jgi:uncharacterized protein